MQPNPRDARTLIFARSVRAFADGGVSVLLASYLSALSFSPFEIGAIVTGTLLGSAALTLAVGLFGGGLRRRAVLLGASALMLLTGIGFYAVTAFVPLLIIAVVGTLNPSSGDVSMFLPTEQAVLSDAVTDGDRTSAFARYNVAANFAGAIGSLASGVPAWVARQSEVSLVEAQRYGFLVYALVAVIAGLFYRTLSPAADGDVGRRPAVPLAKSRKIVLRLATLFSLDSAAGGFVVQALLALWLFKRFHLAVETAGVVFFVASILAAFSQFISGKLAARIGLINTMVFTHLPANVFLALAAFMPTAELAIGCLLLRMSLSQMDVPARQSFVMSVVPPEERAAAASVTNVPRSLASATTPLIAGALLGMSTFGWPLIIAGASKSIYDLLLLIQFRRVKPHEEK